MHNAPTSQDNGTALKQLFNKVVQGNLTTQVFNSYERDNHILETQEKGTRG